MSCSATGTPPIYTAIVRNSTVLANKTSFATIRLHIETKYTCVANSKYGSDTRDFSVIFIGKTVIYMKYIKEKS